jgi:hypothetical protein
MKKPTKKQIERALEVVNDISEGITGVHSIKDLTNAVDVMSRLYTEAKTKLSVAEFHIQLVRSFGTLITGGYEKKVVKPRKRKTCKK